MILLIQPIRSVAQADVFLKTYNDASQNDTVRLIALYDLIWEKLYTNLDSAEVLTNTGLNSELTAKHPKYKYKFYNAYATIWQIKGNYLNAINYYQQGLRLCEGNNDLRGQAIMLGNIGGVYIKIKQYDLSLNFFKKCLGVLKRLKDRANEASVYNNLCIIYLAQKNYDLSLNYVNQSISIYKELDDKFNLTYAYNNLANIYEEKKLNDLALENYKTALKYAIETENSNEIARTYSEIGHIYFVKGDYEQSYENLKKAEKLSLETEDIDTQSDVYNNLYQYYKKKNKPAETLDAFEKYRNLKDSLDQESRQRDISKIQFEYEYQKKVEADSVKMATERAVNLATLQARDAKLAQAKIQLIAIIVVVVMLVIVAFVIYNRFRLTQRQKVIIEAKNKQTEEQKLIIEEKQKEIVDSINYAKRIQDSLLDNVDTIKKFFNDAFVLNNPKDIVSGDFYWLSKKFISESKEGNAKSVVTEQFFIAVCDSTGHGVPGGFMSLLNMAYLSEAINEKNILEPNKIFEYVRERLINTISKNDQKDGFDGVLMRFDKQLFFENKQLVETKFKLAYSAAYNAPILIRNNELTEMGSDKMPVGFGERDEQFKLYEVDLKPNDIIHIYTDGYADQFGGPRGKKFKYKQLNDLLLSISSLQMEKQKELLDTNFEDWKGSMEQVDDVCMIGIRI